MLSLARFGVAMCAAVLTHGEPAVDAVKEPTPPATLSEGAVVYRTLTGRDAQVVFSSDAPLEKIVGKSNAVVGYAVPGPADNPAKLECAAWILPVNSLATGIPLRDDHMTGDEWLDAKDYPTIEFVLSRTEEVKEVKRGEGFTTWSCTLVGTMKLHGVEREIKVADARLSFFDESEKTRKIAPGKLAFLKCEYVVKLSDYGITHADVPDKVSDEVKLTQMLRLSSASREEINAANEAAKESAPTKAE
jgi:polyisoprenoid-binding protein YceI